MAFDAGAIVGKSKLQTQEWQSGIDQMLKSVVSFAAIAKGFQVVTSAAEDSIKNANEYQKAFSNVGTIVDTSTVSMTALSQQVLALNPSLGKSTDIANALYQTFSSGATTAKDAMDITVQSAMFAKAALTDTTTAVDAITTAINAYGSGTVSAKQASDIFFQVVKDGKVTGDELAQSIGRSIPLFSSVGISLEQLGAGVATLTQVGVKSHEAMTQLNAIVNSFLKPSTEMQDALQKVGYASGAAFIKANGLTGALKFLQEQSGGAADKLSDLLPNVDAVRGAMALSGPSAKFYSDSLKDITNSAGSTQTAFDRQEKTFDTMNNAMANLSVSVGNIGKHYVDDLAIGATLAAEGTQKFINSADGMKIVAEVAGDVAGTFAGLQAIFKPLIDEIAPGFTRIFKSVGDTLKSVTGEVGKSNPIMLGLALAGEQVGFAFKVTTIVISNTVRTLGDLINVIIAATNVAGSFFGDGLGKGKWDVVEKNIKTVGDSFKTFVDDSANGTKELVTAVYDQISTIGSKTQAQAVNITTSVTTAYTQAKKDVINNYGAMAAGANSASTAMIDSAARLRAALGQEAKATYNLNTAYDALNKKLSEDYYHKLTDITALSLDERKEALERFRREGKIADSTYASESVALWTEAYNQIYKKIAEFSTLSISTTQYMINQVSALLTQSYTNDKAKLDNKYGKELAALKKSHDDKLITDDEYNAKVTAVQEQQKADENDLAKKQFEANKFNQIANATISASQSIMGWWQAAAALGPVAGPIFAGVMTGATATLLGTQIALISGQEFVPQYAEGGTKRGDGLARVNEQGGELQRLKDGTMIIPADLSAQIAAAVGGGNITMHNDFGGANFTDKRHTQQILEQMSRTLGAQLRKANR